MSKWEMMKLGDISDVITKGTTPTSIGYHFENDGINFLKIESIREDGSFIKEKLQYISEECNEKLKRSILRENDILFSIAGALGRSAVVTTEILPANINQALAIIRIKQRMAISQYVQYVLKSHFVFRQFQKQKQGVAQLNLSLKNISDIAIPLPPLEVQQKIAETLDAAAALLALRKEQLKELDKLIKSVFYEMFGDPVTNEKGWEAVILSDFYLDDKQSVKCGPFGSALKKAEYVSQGIPVWVMDNITKEGAFIDHAFLFINDNKYRELKNYNVQNQDIIVSRAGTVGKMCVVNTQYDKSIISTNLIRVRLNNQLLPVYVVKLIGIWGNRVCRLKKGGDDAFTHMNTNILDNISFPYPPLSLQTQFAAIVTKIEEQKALVQKAIDESQYLFDSLMNEYFN